jgi:hypothetical protein
VWINIDIGALGSLHILFRVTLLLFKKLTTQSVRIELKRRMLNMNSRKSFHFVEAKQSQLSQRIEIFMVHCHLMTPNISLTATRIRDNPRSCESKKRHSSATYANVRERSDHVDATFLGVNHPRIITLSHSLTLTFQPKPIHAQIAPLTILKSRAPPTFHSKKGPGRLDNGCSVFTLPCNDCEKEEAAKAETGEESAPSLRQKIGELTEKIATLRERIENWQTFRETLESRELKTQQALRRIINTLNTRQSYDPPRLPRFAPPHPGEPPKPRPPIELSLSIVWKAADVDPAPHPEVSEMARPRQSKRDPNPMFQFPMTGEMSLCLDDMTSFYNRIGLYTNEYP